MIFLVPEKSFNKKIQKWVLPKDFVIADARDRQDGAMSKYGNVIQTEELAPTPQLTKIVLEPDLKESQIKKARISLYIDRWLADPSFITKVYHLVNTLVESYRLENEDVNIFVVMRSKIFYAYHEVIENKINEDYGMNIASFLTHKMDKADVKAKLSQSITKDQYQELKKRLKVVRKAYDISKTPTVDID